MACWFSKYFGISAKILYSSPVLRVFTVSRRRVYLCSYVLLFPCHSFAPYPLHFSGSVFRLSSDWVDRRGGGSKTRERAQHGLIHSLLHFLHFYVWFMHAIMRFALFSLRPHIMPFFVSECRFIAQSLLCGVGWCCACLDAMCVGVYAFACAEKWCQAIFAWYVSVCSFPPCPFPSCPNFFAFPSPLASFLTSFSFLRVLLSLFRCPNHAPYCWSVYSADQGACAARGVLLCGITEAVGRR